MKRSIQSLPEGLTHELAERFVGLPADPSPTQIEDILMSDSARNFMGQVRADIRGLDPLFELSGG